MQLEKESLTAQELWDRFSGLSRFHTFTNSGDDDIALPVIRWSRGDVDSCDTPTLTELDQLFVPAGWGLRILHYINEGVVRTELKVITIGVTRRRLKAITVLHYKNGDREELD
jgi:hypothetical protein